MTSDKFIELLSQEISSYKDYLETPDNQWVVKGFIDVDKNIYTITNDTKVVSKIIEILLIPKLDIFAKRNGLCLELPSKQNYYPDLTFKDAKGNLFAVDFKTSYYFDGKINGLTLGSYWGYFRNRDRKMSMDYPYNSYQCHVVLGLLYKQSDAHADETGVYNISDLDKIKSVIQDFIFFLQPKWKIALDRPGSGNTRNIGGVIEINRLINGTGPFAELGEEIFDDYWMNYYNAADAKNYGPGKPNYSNLESYKAYRNNSQILNKLR